MNTHKLLLVSLSVCFIILIPLEGINVSQSGIPQLKTEWENAWTLTSFHENGRRNSTIFPFPKTIWNGSQWVDHVFNSLDMSGGIGSIYVKFLSTHATLYDPVLREVRVEDERWEVEWYNDSVNEWIADARSHDEISYTVNSTCICFVRNSTLESGSSLRVFYILRNGARLKYLIELTSATTKKYRILWKLSGINSTKVRLARATIDLAGRTIIGNNQEERRTNSWIHFLNNLNNTIFTLDWIDTFYLNETTGEYGTYFQGLELSPSAGYFQARVWFGNFSLTEGATVYLDPKTTTFESEPSLDGWIEKYSVGQYPPEQHSSVSTGQNTIWVGQRRLPYNATHYRYNKYRGYVSFNTLSISAMAYNLSAKLKLKPVYEHSILPKPDFLMKVIGGEQPIYKNESCLTVDDWDAGNVTVATWNTTDHPGADVYFNLTIPADQINRVGKTQLRLVSKREEDNIQPSTPDEFIFFYSGDSVGNEPILEVVYYLNSVQIEGDATWYYRELNNSKAVIILFGAYPRPTYVSIRSIDYYKSPNDREKTQAKIDFIDGLIAKDFGVLTLNATHVYNTSTCWLEDAAIWLLDKQDCEDVFLFGHSGGGVAVAYEIQKDNATIYSAAVVASAPVNWTEEFSDDLWKSAQTANETEVCTSFIVCENDTGAGNIYGDMCIYYNNMVVHNEWHNWTKGDDAHDIFPDICVDHPNETLVDAVANWYLSHAKDIRVTLMFSNSYWSQYANFTGQPHLTCWLNSSFEIVIKDDHAPWNETAPTYFNKTIRVNCTWTKYWIEDLHFECLWPNGTLTNMNVNFSFTSPNSTDLTEYYDAEFEADNKNFYNISDVYDLHLYANSSCPTYEGEDYDIMFEVILYPRCIDFTGSTAYEPDAIVDMRDVAKIAQNFGDEKGEEGWDIYDEWAHDVVRNYEIDMWDQGLVASKFGWTPP